MLDREIEKKEEEGYKLYVRVNGQNSTRNKRSNLSRAMQSAKNDYPRSDVIHVVGAKRMRASEGFKMAVLYKPKKKTSKRG